MIPSPTASALHDQHFSVNGSCLGFVTESGVRNSCILHAHRKRETRTPSAQLCPPSLPHTYADPLKGECKVARTWLLHVKTDLPWSRSLHLLHRKRLHCIAHEQHQDRGQRRQQDHPGDRRPVRGPARGGLRHQRHGRRHDPPRRPHPLDPPLPRLQEGPRPRGKGLCLRRRHLNRGEKGGGHDPHQRRETGRREVQLDDRRGRDESETLILRSTDSDNLVRD